jgi:DNA repair protein RadC
MQKTFNLLLGGVRVLDHIIVGRTRQDYFSFARAGMVWFCQKNE